MKRSKNLRKPLNKHSDRRDEKIKIKGKGTWDSPYEKVMVINGRGFVMDEEGDVHEIGKDGKLIPDHKVKPV